MQSYGTTTRNAVICLSRANKAECGCKLFITAQTQINEAVTWRWGLFQTDVWVKLLTQDPALLPKSTLPGQIPGLPDPLPGLNLDLDQVVYPTTGCCTFRSELNKIHEDSCCGDTVKVYSLMTSNGDFDSHQT